MCRVIELPFNVYHRTLLDGTVKISLKSSNWDLSDCKLVLKITNQNCLRREEFTIGHATSIPGAVVLPFSNPNFRQSSAGQTHQSYETLKTEGFGTLRRLRPTCMTRTFAVQRPSRAGAALDPSNGACDSDADRGRCEERALQSALGDTGRYMGLIELGRAYPTGPGVGAAARPWSQRARHRSPASESSQSRQPETGVPRAASPPALGWAPSRPFPGERAQQPSPRLAEYFRCRSVPSRPFPGAASRGRRYKGPRRIRLAQ